MLRKKLFLFSLIVTYTLCSCGIDDVVYLEPPAFVHSPTGHNDENEKYFEFKTADKKNSEEALGFFKGSEIYYRIYDSEKECKTTIDNILNYNRSTPSNAVNNLLSSYKFKLLTYRGHSYQNRPLIPASGSSTNRTVRFRLETEFSLQNELRIDNTVKGKTLRQTGEEFFTVKKDDYDVQTSSNADPDFFYVAAFAASYGFDKNFKPLYSSLISLGYVKIKKNL